MTIQLLSLNRIGLGLILLSTSALAQYGTCPKEFKVLERTKGGGYEFTSRELEDLYCNDTFEGKHFKIVYATEETAISFHNPDKELIKKAANVYYHLTLARNFWVNEIKSDYVELLPKTTIRIDITNAFSDQRHFKNAEQEKNYNNAWTIPDGSTPKFAKEKKTWGKEIWFSPMKKLETKDLIQTTGANPIHQSLVIVKEPVTEFNKNGLIYQGVGALFIPSMINRALIDSALKKLGAIAVMFTLVEITRDMDQVFREKYFYINTSMIPEIIYHEFAHIALSDTMKTVHSVPVIEGMADYFAARMANRTKMYESIKDFSKNKAKDLKNKTLYDPSFEESYNATSDFTLGLLWQGKEAFDKFNEQRAKKGQAAIVNYDQLVFNAHFKLNENSNIATHLAGALTGACKKLCQNSRAGVNILNNLFENKGMN